MSIFNMADADEFITDIDPVDALDLAMDEYEDVDEWEEDDEHDGQPDEAQEWHDFDPDC